MPNIKDIPVRHVMNGIDGHYAHGAQTTFGWVMISSGTKMPAHSHPHEQVTFIVEGELEMTIGGETKLLKQGMYEVIPGNTPHSANAYVDCIAIDVFWPVREEYKGSGKWEVGSGK